MEAMAEALEQAEGEEDLDAVVEKALACPCVQDLRSGECGKPFDAAFTCFVKHSKDEDIAGKCIDDFLALQRCMAEHPDDFAEYIPGQSPEEKEENMELAFKEKPIAQEWQEKQQGQRQGEGAA